MNKLYLITLFWLFVSLVACSKNTIELKHNGGVLTQAMLSQPNTEYLIRYDYDLKGDSVVVPENCRFIFEGGSIKNGKLRGDLKNDYLRPEWFGAKGDGISDDRMAIEQCIALCSNLKLGNKTYCIASKKSKHKIFEMDGDLSIEGNGAHLFLSNKLYENYNSSVDLFSDAEKENQYKKKFEDFTITTDVIKNDDFKGNFYLFHLYSKEIEFSKIKVKNEGKRNGLNVITVNYTKDLKLEDCHFENRGEANMGGILWFMQKESPKDDTVYVDVRRSNFIHDGKDETICFGTASSSTSNCYVRYVFDECQFISPNKKQGSGFFIFYDNRKEGSYVYDTKGIISNSSFISQKGGDHNYRRVFGVQRGAGVFPCWNLTFDKCVFESQDDYYQIHGKNNEWKSNYLFGQSSLKHIEGGSFSLFIKNSKILTKNSLFNAYSGGCAGDIKIENCDISCRALKVGNANADKVLTRFQVRNTKLNTIYPYTFGGNEYWENCEITSTQYDFLLSPISPQRYVEKRFSNCGFNGQVVKSGVKYDGVSVSIDRYCHWRHNIYNDEKEIIAGALLTEQAPKESIVQKNMEIRNK